MGKTDLEKYQKGVERADRDIDRVNAYIQTGFGGDKLPGRLWLLKGKLLAAWCGFSAPLQGTKAGKGYDDRIQSVTSRVAGRKEYGKPTI